jgi:clan AA aspartic protease
MIRGHVNDRREGIVRLTIRGPHRVEAEVSVTVDTGYTEFLTIPSSLGSSIGLVVESIGTGVLADGTLCDYDICEAEVMWDGRWIPISVSVLDGGPLLGMRILAGYRLTIDVEPGGDVSIESLG